MSTNLSEEEMRAALFGVVNVIPQENSLRSSCSPAKAVSKNSGTKIKVTLHVGNEFEGAYEVVSYESSSLSRLVVEMDARKNTKRNISISRWFQWSEFN